MDQNIYKKLLSDTHEYLSRLNQALIFVKKDDPDNRRGALFYDGMIKRFEVLFSKAVNLLRLSLIEEGIETISPRQVLQEAGRLNWITDIDFWMVALDAKMSSLNGTSDLTPQEYHNIVTQFATEVEVIINLLQELREVT